LENDDTQFGANGTTANTEGSSDDIDTQLDAYSDALSSVMKDDSGYITRLPAWESAELANSKQLRQRRRQLGPSTAEDGEVRTEVNGRREGGKKSTTPTETALPKSTYTRDDASARPIFSRAAARHTEEKTSLHIRFAPLQLVPTRDAPYLPDVILPEEQQRPESSLMKEQPRRVTVKEIGQELAELRRLGRLAKDLDQLDETAVRVGDLESGFYFNRHVGLVEPPTGAAFEHTDQTEVRSDGRQGNAYGACPNGAGLYGLLGNTGDMNPDGAYSNGGQSSLTDAQMLEVDKVLRKQTPERTTELELLGTLYPVTRMKCDNSSCREGSAIESELRAIYFKIHLQHKEEFGNVTNKAQTKMMRWTCNARERRRARMQKRARPDIHHVSSIVRRKGQATRRMQKWAQLNIRH